MLENRLVIHVSSRVDVKKVALRLAADPNSSRRHHRFNALITTTQHKQVATPLYIRHDHRF